MSDPVMSGPGEMPDPGGTSDVEDVRIGQKLILYAVLANIAGLVLRFVGGEVGLIAYGLLALAALVMAIVGLVRAANGLGFSGGKMALFIVLFLIPLLGLFALVYVNQRATERLRAAGYSVGLMGARRR